MSTNANGAPTSPDSIPKFNTASDVANGKGVNEMMDSLQTIITQLKAGTLASGKIAAAGITAGSAGQVLTTSGGVSTWVTPSQGATLLSTPAANNNASNALVANQAYLVPLVGLQVPSTFQKFQIPWVSGVAGTVDAGAYYSDDGATFTRVQSLGSVSCPTSVPGALFTTTQFTLTPVTGRKFYLALSASSATPLFTFAGSMNLFGDAYTKTSSHPLPATISLPSSSVAMPSPIWTSY